MQKKIKIIIIIMLLLIFIISGRVFAAPQSSPNVSRTNQYFGFWLSSSALNSSGSWQDSNVYIKQMANSSGAMGTTGSLNVHLQKNSEYGSMLIFAVSDYGKQGNGTSGSDYITRSTYGLATTTGNETGVYQIGGKEFVAAGFPSSTYSYYLNTISTRERNEYKISNSKTGSTVATPYVNGDAMTIGNWQGGSKGAWIYSDGASSTKYYYIFTRTGFGYSSILSYDQNLWRGSSTASAKYYYGMCGPAYARACIINGAY